MPKRKTHEKFIEEMKIKQPNIEVLDKYIDSKTKIKCKCKVDNHIWYTRPNDLLQGKGCPKCARRNVANKERKSQEQFIEEMKVINSSIKVLGTYVKNNTKILVKCKVCNHEWEAIPNSLLKGCGCPKCYGNIKKNHEKFMIDFKSKSIHADNIEILNEYKNARTKIKCKCKICGNEWETQPHNLLNGHGCLECTIKNNTGENSPRWNPNITQEEREQGRGYYEYNEFTRKVYERDNYTCQVTGQRGGKLVVHHLYGYNKYKCLRTVVENGITLSKEVHDLFHSIYGKGNNTLEQFEDFLQNYYNKNLKDII